MIEYCECPLTLKIVLKHDGAVITNFSSGAEMNFLFTETFVTVRAHLANNRTETWAWLP